MKLTKDELRIIETALSFDIKDQEKFLSDVMGGEKGLEKYLEDTKKIKDKIEKYLYK